MDVIITGATSMIGAATVRQALSRGRRVAAVVRENSPQAVNLRALGDCRNLEIVTCGIHDYATLNFNSRYDAFIHMAWHSTGLDVRDDAYRQIDNIACEMDAVHAAGRAGCSVFVDAGSQAEYGRAAGKLAPGTPCDPESGYGTAKYAAGKLALLTATRLGLRCCHTRVLSVYGEGMAQSTLIVYLIKTLLAGRKPSLTKCEQLWDYLYVRDAADAFLAVADRGVHGKAYPLGSGVVRPLREYVSIIREMINPDIALGFGEKEYYPHQPMFLCADITELTEDTGFAPRYDFAEGIKNTITWVMDSEGTR